MKKNGIKDENKRESKKRRAVGLYELVGGSQNGELSSNKVEDFLARNILEPEI